MCSVYVSLTAVFKALAKLRLNNRGPASDEVDLLIGFFLRVDAGYLEEDCVQLARDVVDGECGALQTRILARHVLVGHEQLEEPVVKLRHHHDLHAVVRVPLRQHLQVGQRPLPYQVVRVRHQRRQQLQVRDAFHLVAFVDHDVLVQ